MPQSGVMSRIWFESCPGSHHTNVDDKMFLAIAEDLDQHTDLTLDVVEYFLLL